MTGVWEWERDKGERKRRGPRSVAGVTSGWNGGGNEDLGGREDEWVSEDVGGNEDGGGIAKGEGQKGKRKDGLDWSRG